MGYSESWINILNKVEEFRGLIAADVWFRGQRNAQYKLESGLFRMNFGTELNLYLQKERGLYHRFKNLGHLHHQEEGWNLLFLMQHHGVRTRLLDWTESFAVALYFACIGWEKGTKAIVWMLKPNYLNLISTGRSHYWVAKTGQYEEFASGEAGTEAFPLNSFAMYPTRNSPRIVAQQGGFTVQGNSLTPLENELFKGQTLRGDILGSIELTDDMRDDVVKFLTHSGINHYTMFPDLIGLARHINNSGRVDYYFEKE